MLGVAPAIHFPEHGAKPGAGGAQPVLERPARAGRRTVRPCDTHDPLGRLVIGPAFDPECEAAGLEADVLDIEHQEHGHRHASGPRPGIAPRGSREQQEGPVAQPREVAGAGRSEAAQPGRRRPCIPSGRGGSGPTRGPQRGEGSTVQRGHKKPLRAVRRGDRGLSAGEGGPAGAGSLLQQKRRHRVRGGGQGGPAARPAPSAETSPVAGVEAQRFR